MSTLKVNTIQNTSGGSSSTPEQIEQGRCKVWLNMNGEPSESIRDSFNVSSFTDNGTGDFVVNFATAMANANYVVGVLTSRNNGNTGDICNWGGVSGKTVNGFDLGVYQTNSNFSSSSHRGNLQEIVDVMVFGD
tara:strand:- start:136 stop:537 length:402 start_codon:yes stop_codon:yes gene_type:complete